MFLLFLLGDVGKHNFIQLKNLNKPKLSLFLIKIYFKI